MTLQKLIPLAVAAVEASLSGLPAAFRPLVAQVPVHYEGRPGRDLLHGGFEPDILGLFTGSPHGSELSEDQPMPPEIILFLENLWDFAEGDQHAFNEEVRLTYLHELGHYFGWDEDDLAERGLA